MERFNQSWVYLPVITVGVILGGLVVLYVASTVGQQQLQQVETTNPLLKLLTGS